MDGKTVVLIDCTEQTARLVKWESLKLSKDVDLSDNHIGLLVGESSGVHLGAFCIHGAMSSSHPVNVLGSKIIWKLKSGTQLHKRCLVNGDLVLYEDNSNFTPELWNKIRHFMKNVTLEWYEHNQKVHHEMLQAMMQTPMPTEAELSRIHSMFWKWDMEEFPPAGHKPPAFDVTQCMY